MHLVADWLVTCWLVTALLIGLCIGRSLCLAALGVGIFKQGTFLLHHPVLEISNCAYLIIVVQPDPLQRHDLAGLLVLGLEHRAVRAFPGRRIELKDLSQFRITISYPLRSSRVFRTAAFRTELLS